MGLSSKKSTTNTTSSYNNTSTPTNPAQVTGGLTGFADNITNLQNRDPYSFTVGANPLQTQAGQTASQLGSSMPTAQQNFNENMMSAEGNTVGLLGANAPHMGAATAYGGIQNYMDPYLNSVVNTSTANYDRNDGYQRAQAKLDMGNMDDTFGGSGAASYLGNRDATAGLGRAQLEAGLRSQGYTQALAAAQADADRQQQANATNAGLENSNLDRRLTAANQQGALAGNFLTGNTMIDANNRDNIASQGGTGEALRQIELQHQLAPLTTASTIAGLWGSTPLGLLHGENDNGQSQSTSTTKTSDPMGTIAGVLGGVGSLATGLGAMGLGGNLAGMFGGQMLGGSGALGLGGNTLGGLKGLGAGANALPI